MPFAERQVTDLRAEFVALAQHPGVNRRALCRRFGIAPATAYKWLRRYATEGVAACPNQRTAIVRAQLVTAFQRYGLPDRLLVDNGSPWGNHPAHPCTPLTVWLRRLGIAVSHSQPYHPQTLGQGRALPRHLGARAGAAAAAARPRRLADRLRRVAARGQPRPPA